MACHLVGWLPEPWIGGLADWWFGGLVDWWIGGLVGFIICAAWQTDNVNLL
jgi:hypothetical protein